MLRSSQYSYSAFIKMLSMEGSLSRIIPKSLSGDLIPRGMGFPPNKLQSKSTDFLFLISVSGEFSLGLFSTALSGVLTSSFTAVLEDLFPGERKWPRELPSTHHGQEDKVVTAKREPNGA